MPWNNLIFIMIIPRHYARHYNHTDQNRCMEHISSFLDADPFSRELGIKLESASKNSATLSLVITENHLNPHGTVHGGVIYTLADAAFAVASNADGTPSVAINTSISYMKAVKSGKLIAKAHEFSKNHTLGSYIVEIHDLEGEKIAVFQGLAYHKRR